MRTPKKNDNPPESLHAPVRAAEATTGPTPPRALRERALGATAITLAASIAVQNAMFGWADAPGYGDPIDDVLAWHQQNRVVVAIAVGQEALHLLLLLGFLTGLHGLVERRRGAGADWSRLAVAAGATLSAVLALYSVLWIGAVLSAGELAVPSPAFVLAWQLHAAAFALALPALGTTCIGAALAAHASSLTPPWQRLLGVAGGGLLLVAGAASLAIADGSAILFVGMPGYAGWLVWLFATGVRLVRARADGRADASTTGHRSIAGGRGLSQSRASRRGRTGWWRRPGGRRSGWSGRSGWPSSR